MRYEIELCARFQLSVVAAFQDETRMNPILIRSITGTPKNMIIYYP